MARQVGPSGQVIAVEPAPGARARLRRNLSLNDLTNVVLVAAALGDRDTENAELHLQSSYPLSGRGGPERVLTCVARLDSLVAERQLERVDFIKVDVDGQEARVLRGALGTLRRFRPPVFFELTPTAVEAGGESIEALFGSLLNLGYSISDEGGTRWHDPARQAGLMRRGAGCNLLALPSPPPSSSPQGVVRP
jgi:FkbM family methyltransferase